MGDILAQNLVDARLPALAAGAEFFDHIGGQAYGNELFRGFACVSFLHYALFFQLFLMGKKHLCQVFGQGFGNGAGKRKIFGGKFPHFAVSVC
ncbi:Uncharacterised protein [Neisseria meningitidis]|nr:Uncharacterised protein [Neisseria meningitidis]